MLCGGAVLYRLRVHRRVLWSIAMLCPAGLAAALVIDYGLWEVTALQIPLLDKFLDPRGWADAELRIRLQVRALELILFNPAGLHAAGLNWLQDGFWHVFASSRPGFIQRSVTVHNSYLGPSLDYGWGVLAPAIVMLAFFTRTAWKILRDHDRLPPALRTAALAAGAAALGLFYPQAMVHNAGILTLEPVSIFVFALVVAIEVVRRRLPPAPRGAPGVQRPQPRAPHRSSPDDATGAQDRKPET
jgi:hypothetical protein